MTTLLIILGILLITIGFFGTILPLLPGAPLIFLGSLILAYADDFNQIGLVTLIIIAVLAVVSLIVDFACTYVGVKRMGASPKAVWGAIIGSIIGIFSGLWGLLFMPFIGAVVGELLAKRGVWDAGKAGFGTIIAMIVSTVLKVSLGFSMIGTILLSYL